jgi:tight adherence protein C
MWIALSVFLACFLLILSAGRMLVARAEKAHQLIRIGPARQESALGDGVPAQPFRARIEKFVHPFQRVLPRTEQEVSRVQRQLIRAGFREVKYVNLFYASKVLTPCVLCLVALLFGAFQLSPLFVYTTAACLGYLIPDFWLGRRIAARATEIRLGLPEAMDLLVICVEAGLSLDRATLRTADELRRSQPAVADEMGLVSLEQRAGCPRGDAWKHCAERTGVDSVRALAALLIQADKFGTSVGKALRAHALALRTRRRQDAEEQAAKTTVKLVFPLVLFIFPSIFVVTLGPSMIIMFEAFDQLLS